MQKSPTRQKLTVDDMVTLLSHKLSTLAAGERYLLGIVGYPGAGKTTVSAWLEAGVNQLHPNRAKVVPMDGFHLSNEQLKQMRMLEYKGIPETFDGHGFTRLLKRLRTNSDQIVYCPRFERGIEASIPDDIAVLPINRLCIIEGNYLLLDREPWRQCKKILDEIWFLDVPFSTITPRLLARHMQGGRTPEGAKVKVESTDLPNARLIEQSKPRADMVIDVAAHKIGS